LRLSEERGREVSYYNHQLCETQFEISLNVVGKLSSAHHTMRRAQANKGVCYRSTKCIASNQGLSRSTVTARSFVVLTSLVVATSVLCLLSSARRSPGELGIYLAPHASSLAMCLKAANRPAVDMTGLETLTAIKRSLALEVAATDSCQLALSLLVRTILLSDLVPVSDMVNTMNHLEGTAVAVGCSKRC
jgi:hypothetical protein